MAGTEVYPRPSHHPSNSPVHQQRICPKRSSCCRPVFTCFIAIILRFTVSILHSKSLVQTLHPLFYSAAYLGSFNRAQLPERPGGGGRQLHCTQPPSSPTANFLRTTPNHRYFALTFLSKMPPAIPATDLLGSSPHPLDLRSLLASVPKHAPRAISSLPTRSLNPASLASLFRRQVIVTVTTTSVNNPIVPAYYSGLGTGPTPGTVAGIVFGAVGGFLLLLWLVYTCFTFGNNNFGRSSVIAEEDIVRRRSRSSRRSRRSSRSEVIEVRESHHSRSRSRSRSRTPPRSNVRESETIVIEERTRRAAPRSEHEDVVEVFEEHSPVRRESRTERTERKSSGFRTVDPEAYGGGDRPYRKVSRRG